MGRVRVGGVLELARRYKPTTRPAYTGYGPETTAPTIAPEPVNYRKLGPVTENVAEPDGFSQTFLSHVDNCPRAGYLYRLHRNGPTSHAMDRGTAFHIFAKEATQAIIDGDDGDLPPDVTKAIMQGVIGERLELTFTAEDKDDLRIMAFHWGEGTYFPPKHIGAIEQELELELAGGRVRGTPDLITLYPEQAHAEVWDYKTSFNVPNQRAFERSFQTKFYALLLAFGKGVDDAVGFGGGLKTFDVIEAYPRYLMKEGLLTRRVRLERSDLADFRHDVEATIARAAHGFDTGHWQAVTSSHCNKCPMPLECPLPPILIPAGELRVGDDPVMAAERLFHLGKAKEGAQNDLRGYSKEHGPIYYGPVEPGKPGRVYGPKLTTSEKIKKRRGQTSIEALTEAIEQAAEDGKSFDPASVFTVSSTTRFEDRKHEPDDYTEDHDAS